MRGWEIEERDYPETITPEPWLPEMRLRSPGAEPPTVLPSPPSIMTPMTSNFAQQLLLPFRQA